jgi:hypothetical protein
MSQTPSFAARFSSLRSMSRAACVALLAAAPAATGCTSLQSVSVTQIPGDRSRPVHAEVSNTAFLGIHFDNDFLEELTPQLLAQCPHGRITGLLTKQESSLYVIIATRRVIATGYCVHDGPAMAAATPAPAPPGASSGPANPAAPAAPPATAAPPPAGSTGWTTQYQPPAPAREEHGS